MSVHLLIHDVLLHIASYLYGRDALQLALCSKAYYEVAFPRVPAIARCNSLQELRRLHRYMLSGSPPHAHYLRDLSIGLLTFESPEDDDVSYGDYWDFAEQAPLIADILVRAQGLRNVLIERLHPCLAHDERIGPALASMEQLVYAEFSTVADGTFARLPGRLRLGASLKHLRLAYFWKEDDDLEDESKTLERLFEVLATLPNLSTIGIWNLDPPISGLRARSTQPSLPSVKDLCFSLCSPGALELVAAFPRLSSLDVSLHHDMPVQHSHAQQRWPPLQALTLSTSQDISHILGYVGGADNVRITREIAVIPHAKGAQENVDNLFTLLARTSPIRLSLSVAVDSSPMTFWKDVPAIAPRLQILEVNVTSAICSTVDGSCLDILADSLRSLPLVYLSVVVPRAVTIRGLLPHDILGHMTQGRQLAGTPYANAQDIHQRYEQSVKALPGRLAFGIPTLRFLSMAAQTPNKTRLAVSEGGGSDLLDSAYYSEASPEANTKHWRVERGSAPDDRPWRLIELSADDGERSRSLAEQAQRSILEAARR